MPTNAQNSFPVSGGHRGAIRSIIYDGSRIITAGTDGFLEFWNLQNRAAEERFQLSVLSLKMMCLRPERPHIAVVESNGKRSRVSAWNYATKEKLFSMDFNAEPVFINYSGAGGFLLVSTPDLTGILYLNGDTGKLLHTIPNTAGSVTFAATGKSETSIISYMPSGAISYWSLSQETEMRRCKTVAGLQTPVLFGNNRFIAGIGTSSSEGKGLFVIDAITGKTLDYDPRIVNGFVYAVQSDSPDFICISENADRIQTIHFFTVNSLKKIEPKHSPHIINTQSRVESLTAVQNTTAFGTADGNVWIFNYDGSSRMLAVKNPLLIREIAVVGNDTLVFLVNKTFAAIPLNWRLLEEKGVSFGESDFSHITAAEDGFILWSENEKKPQYHLAIGKPSIELPYQSRFPLRTVTSFNGKALFLDAVGEIIVFSLETNKSIFTFSSAGFLDAAFLDDRNIIVGRGDGITPFLRVNLVTGETVPLTYPALVGVRVYRAASGIMYGGVISHVNGEQKTVLIRFDLTNTAQSQILTEAQGENLTFAVAEASGIAVSTLSSGQAMTLPLDGREMYTSLEQEGGFPVHLIDGGSFFVSVDTDGVISWHDPQTGYLLAQFRLYADEWTLE
jgi:WD40 repeat protein